MFNILIFVNEPKNKGPYCKKDQKLQNLNQYFFQTL